MRGCLSVIVLGALFLAAIVWVAGPPLASAGDSIVLFTPSPALGLRLTSLAATSSGLELHGSLDVGALLR
ncbi:MAG: hypothetical protein ACXWXA_10830 [Candidatus Limnocylindrales bacterium]